MSPPIAYLTFNGNCAEAMQFYAQVLDARLPRVLTYGESPMASDTPTDKRGLVLHARLKMPGGGMLWGQDHMSPTGAPYPGIHGVSVALSYDTVEEAQRRFALLGVGGQITAPMAKVFWAEAFGMLTDRFGVPWIINSRMKL